MIKALIFCMIALALIVIARGIVYLISDIFTDVWDFLLMERKHMPFRK